MEPNIEIELAGRPWEFDLFGIFIIEGKIYTGHDSGCSCPMPWERVGGTADLIGPLTLREAIKAIRALEPTDSDRSKDSFLNAKTSAIEELTTLMKTEQENEEAANSAKAAQAIQAAQAAQAAIQAAFNEVQP